MTTAPPTPHSIQSVSYRPNRTDVVFRLGTSVFGLWVVTVAATSPTVHQRPAFWPLFILVGALIAMAMLVGAFMTLKLYLRPEEHRDPGQLPELDDHPDDFPPSWKRHTP